MRDDIFFVIKMLGLTALVIVVLQIKTGGKTLEEQFDTFLKTSIVVDYLQEATDGGIILSKRGYQKADAGVHVLLTKIKRKKDQAKGLHASANGGVDEAASEQSQKPSRSLLFWKRWRRHKEQPSGTD